MAQFTHLHFHSEYSLLDGLSKINHMVSQAKALGMDSLAITDHGSMYGAIYFYQACIAAGIKPIIGCEIYIAPRSRFDKEATQDKSYNHLILLAENNTGYQNLMRIISAAYLEGYYYKPRADLELLKKYHEGLICLSACVNGFVTDPLLQSLDDLAEKRAKALSEIFGPEHFYLELMRHGNGSLATLQDTANKKLIALSRKLGLPLVATNDAHYVYKEDAQAQEILLCIQTQTTIDSPNRKLSMIDSPHFYMKSPDEMAQIFQDLPEAIENTTKIANRCHVEITLGKWHMPIFTVPNGASTKDYLRQKVDEGVTFRYGENPEGKILERVNYELDVITTKGYETYFLVVGDFINWAKDHGISVGPGRGSAAGSVVSYVLKITDIDPFYFQLPFERFLNPLRPSAPDIDLDFADTRREEVIQYVTAKYGVDKVAQIITFGTMEAKGSIRDVGRALGMPYSGPDRISKMIPPGWQGHAMTLEKAMAENPELKSAYRNEEETKRLIDLSKRIEGVVRHSSVHAAGVVIADKPITDYTPVQRETNGEKIVTQYDMHCVGENGVGLLKMDFLGLRNLTIIEESLKFIKENKDIDINISTIPLDDKRAYELLSSGETTGIFQFESSGMRRYIKELRPTNIFDVMAMVALYRPGPMANIPEFIARKRNPTLITYPEPRLEEVLKESYGMLTYQDDVLLTSIKLAGYSWLDADKLRKAMGKKIPEVMKKEEEKFVKGAVKNGLTEKKAKELFTLIAPFAGYGFNKCITADTVITDSDTGKQYTIEELYRSNNRLKLLSLTENYKLKPSPVTAVLENGVKEVFEVVTRRGLKIKATNNHPFLSYEGFKELKYLKEGDRIGTARFAPLPQKRYRVKDYQLAVLGYLLAEGNFCHPSGIYYYSTMQEEINDFSFYVKQFKNAHITMDTSKPAQCVYVGRQNIKDENSLFKWIQKLHLLNKKATEKTIPKFVFQLNRNQLSLFLAKMWQGDGSVTSQHGGQIYYATSSKALAYQMQHLLLRLRIVSTVHNKSFTYRRNVLPGFTINISKYTNVKVFAETLGKHLLGDKITALKEIMRKSPINSGELNAVYARGTKDIIPTAILPVLREEIYKSYASLNGYSVQSGLALRLFSYDAKKVGYLRESIQYIANSLQSSVLDDIGNSDIYWDEIVKITPKGEEMTYDLTIAETHNFVANDFIVHNSHAACYASIAYRTAFLKANYPVEFMTALLTAESRGTTGPTKNEKIAQAVAECKRLKIHVLPPDINKSDAEFSIEHHKHIRFGFTAIKNVGAAAINAILDARKAKPFVSLEDFCQRVDLGPVNKKTLESLIKAGALDQFGKRAVLLSTVSEITEKIHKAKKQQGDGQGVLFADESTDEPTDMSMYEDIEDFSPAERLAFEKEFLGFYLTAHPQEKHLASIKSIITHELETLGEDTSGMYVKVGGILEMVKRIFTKKSNAEMAFISIADEKGTQMEGVIFPKTFETYKDYLVKDTVIIAEGKVDIKEGKAVLLVQKLSKPQAVA